MLIPNSSCPCLSGYFDDGIDVCTKCHYSCVRCLGGKEKDKCTTCPSDLSPIFRIKVTSECVCKDSFYDDGI